MQSNIFIEFGRGKDGFSVSNLPCPPHVYHGPVIIFTFLLYSGEWKKKKKKKGVYML